MYIYIIILVLGFILGVFLGGSGIFQPIIRRRAEERNWREHQLRLRESILREGEPFFERSAQFHLIPVQYHDGGYGILIQTRERGLCLHHTDNKELKEALRTSASMPSLHSGFGQCSIQGRLAHQDGRTGVFTLYHGWRKNDAYYLQDCFRWLKPEEVTANQQSS
jgi:hypothetical protein